MDRARVFEWELNYDVVLDRVVCSLPGSDHATHVILHGESIDS